MMESRRNLAVEGLSFFGGGDYDRISIEGFGVAKSGLSVGQLVVHGIGHFRKRVETGSCSIAGVASFRDSLAVDRLHANGLLAVKGELRARDLEFEGAARITGHVASSRLSAIGSWRCKGDMDLGRGQLEGSIQVRGVLSADAVVLCPDIASRVSDIVADQVTIRRSSLQRKSLWKILCRLIGLRPFLHVGRIEGIDVEVDGVVARRISGHRVRIERYSLVNVVEYSESVDIHPQAQVKKLHQVSSS